MGGAAARMMMVLLGRAFITMAMRIFRRGCVVMIVLAAGLGKVGATGKTIRIVLEDAGIQPGQRANNHQPCEYQFHQAGWRLHAGHCKRKEKSSSMHALVDLGAPLLERAFTSGNPR